MCSRSAASPVSRVGRSAEALELGLVRQLTNVRPDTGVKDSTSGDTTARDSSTTARDSSTSKAEKAKGQRGKLEAEQRELFEAIRDKYRADSIAKTEKAARDSLQRGSQTRHR